MNASSTPVTPVDQSPFMRACRGEPAPYTPVWLMRQAGRYQAEYRAVREKVGFLELCKTPDLAAQVTVFAVEQLGVDAAIIFADILLLLEAIGLPIEFSAEGEGPKINRPVRVAADVDALVADIDAPGALGYVLAAIRKVRAALPRTPLIGFAGAPFTVASYAIEGGGSKNYLHTKGMMYRDPGLFHALMARLTTATVRYLNAQIAAGAHVVQLFDSWVGALGPVEYREFVLPYMTSIVTGVTPGVPVITFATGTGTYTDLIAASGAHVVGVDWRVDLARTATSLPDRAVQGNLDPVALFAPRDTLLAKAGQLLASMRGREGYIFNLGHGILPNTPVDNVRALVDFVHESTAR